LFEALPAGDMSCLYAAADFFTIASQAEGACLPLYEAMAHDLVCVAPNHTAITEALDDGRGVLVEPHITSIHPFGNVNRYHTDPADLAEALLNAERPDNGVLPSFIKSRPWSLAANRVEEALSG
jgi:glycosyltransferase involved in cell wall biosynthesis